jgi:DNA-3-methyladenine glycosylase
MYRPAGTLYVYPIHARYCMNVVTEPEGFGAAVLIRALEPLEPIAFMQQARGTLLRKNLTTGPAKLSEALAVDRRLDGQSISIGSAIWLEAADSLVGERSWQVRSSKRIGISQAKDKLLRWFIDGNRYVSGCARDHTRGRTWEFVGDSEACSSTGGHHS